MICEMTDLRATIRLTKCPATECRHPAPRQITAEDPEGVHEKLERVAEGRPFDYYHCAGWCKRIWRIERYDCYAGEPYHEPELIGCWDGSDCIVYDKPQGMMIDWMFRRSRTDPTKPAQSMKDAGRQ
jgi:hypothetical protein